jgi:hypothetical protein
VATDAALAKIQNHLAAQPGESTGYISPQDIINAFQAALVAVDEVESHLPPQTAAVVTELTRPLKPTNDSSLAVLSDMMGIFKRWQANVDSNPNVDKGGKGTFSPVGGDAVPTTVAQTVVVLNNLIAALEETGIIRDIRGGTNPVVPPQPAPTGMSAPTSPAVVWTFTPVGASLPANLTALKGAANVGDAALNAAGQVEFPPAQYIVLDDGSRARWTVPSAGNGVWVQWTPVITSLLPPTGLGAVQWFFGPAGAVPVADLTALKAAPVVGDAALQGVNFAPFTTGQFIVLGDASKAHYGVQAGAPGIYQWGPGAAP